MQITNQSFTHYINSNTIEHACFVDGVRHCRTYHPSQRDELLANSAGAAAPYIEIAGWTDEYIAATLAEEQRLAAEAQAKADAESAAAREAAIQEQMRILQEAQARLAAGAA